MADMPQVSKVSSEPSVEQLLVLLAGRDAALAERDRVIAELVARSEALLARVAELETRLGKTRRTPPSRPRRMPS